MAIGSYSASDLKNGVAATFPIQEQKPSTTYTPYSIKHNDINNIQAEIKELQNYILKSESFIKVKDWLNGSESEAIQTATLQQILDYAWTKDYGVDLGAAVYKINAELPIIEGALIKGAGRYRSIIQSTVANHNIFNITGQAVKLTDFWIRYVGSIAPTAGTAIKIGDTGNEVTNCSIDDLTIEGFYDNIDFVSANIWELEHNYIVSPVRWGVRIRNTTVGDSGDQVMVGNTFDTSNPNSEACIRHESGGGLKAHANKIMGSKIGYDLQVADGVSTSVLTMTGNSIENQTLNHVRLGRLGTTGNYSLLSFSGNQHNGGLPVGHVGYLIGAGIENVGIGGATVANGLSADTFVKVTTGKAVLVNGVTIQGFGVGVQFDAGAVGCREVGNLYSGVNTRTINNSATSTVEV